MLKLNPLTLTFRNIYNAQTQLLTLKFPNSTISPVLYLQYNSHDSETFICMVVIITRYLSIFKKHSKPSERFSNYCKTRRNNIFEKARDSSNCENKRNRVIIKARDANLSLKQEMQSFCESKRCKVFVKARDSKLVCKQEILSNCESKRNKLLWKQDIPTYCQSSSFCESKRCKVIVKARDYLIIVKARDFKLL